VAAIGVRLPASAVATACALAAAALLPGCASAPPPLAGPVLAGRIAVRSEAAPGHDARSASGQFELRGSPERGQLILTSPIGTVVARARWASPDGGPAQADGPADIVLEADGGTRRFDNFDDMTEAALGQSLPLAAMFDWLAGRPWPHAPAVYDVDRTVFEQLGWHVDGSRYASDGLVAADRPVPPPALHVRVKLDRGDAAPTPVAPSSAPGAAAPVPLSFAAAAVLPAAVARWP
jgi:outer membrane lipoprotein LolB